MRGKWLMLAVLAVAARAAAAPLGLGEALARVAAYGPDAQVARAALPIAEADVHTARMFPNPGLLLSGGRSEPVFSAGLQLRLPILGQREAHVHTAEAELQEARAASELAVWQLRRDARVAYYNVARAEAELTIARDVAALTRRVADMAAERFEVGAGTRLEKEQAALLGVRAQQDVSDRGAALRVARLELARLLGFAVAELPSLGDALAVSGATPPLEALLSQAQRVHPELRALAAEQRAAERRASAARADLRPVPVVDLIAEVLDPTTCNPTLTENTGPRCVGPRANLGFDLPIFNLNGGPIARANAEARAAAVKSDAAWRRVEATLRAAHENWTAATVRARFFDAEYVPAAERVEQMAREGFTAGKTGLLPLIEAERALLDAHLGRAEAQFAVQAARADLEEASGVALSTP
jgi:cobalt-zinc-cadmium efflux system outer membrane protein